MFTKSDVALWWKEPVFTGKYCEPGHNHAFTTGFMGTYITCCANLLGVVNVSVVFERLKINIPSVCFYLDKKGSFVSLFQGKVLLIDQKIFNVIGSFSYKNFSHKICFIICSSITSILHALFINSCTSSCAHLTYTVVLIFLF